MTGEDVTPPTGCRSARPEAGAAARLRGESGQILVVFALGLIALMGFASLGFDTGRFYSERRYLQNATDAGVYAAGAALQRGATDADAITEARAVVARNILNSPTASGVQPPADPPVYADGHAGDPAYLIDGILITSGNEVRVAVRGTSQWTLGGAVGLAPVPIVAQSRGKMASDMLPIAVRQYVYPAGPTAGAAYPCTSMGPHDFQAYIATASTSCLGSVSDASLRTDPSPGLGFDPSNVNNDPDHHGPIQTFVGVNAKPNNAADFRGFINLDTRNFAFNGSNVFYNGVTAGTTSNTLKDLEASYVKTGYPGPDFPPVVSPPDPNDQVAILDGNSSGIALDQINEYVRPGDEFLAAVYSGTVMTIPDFTVVAPNTVSIGTTENKDGSIQMDVTKNTAFAGLVDMSAFKDWGDTQNPYGSTLSALTFTPNPITPAAKATWATFNTSGAPIGIYTVWVQGHSGSPYLTDHYYPVAVNVGGVQRDFNSTVAGLDWNTPTTGGTVTNTFTISTANSNTTAFQGSVSIAVEGGANQNGTLPSGIGARTLSATSVVLGKGDSRSVSLTINAGTLAPGVYSLTVAIWGTNGDGQKVTRLYPITLTVATAATSDNYLDISGFALFRATASSSNTLDGYAISPAYPDPNDFHLRRGQVMKLYKWSD